MSYAIIMIWSFYFWEWLIAFPRSPAINDINTREKMCYKNDPHSYSYSHNTPYILLVFWWLSLFCFFQIFLRFLSDGARNSFIQIMNKFENKTNNIAYCYSSNSRAQSVSKISGFGCLNSKYLFIILEKKTLHLMERKKGDFKIYYLDNIWV